MQSLEKPYQNSCRVAGQHEARVAQRVEKPKENVRWGCANDRGEAKIAAL